MKLFKFLLPLFLLAASFNNEAANVFNTTDGPTVIQGTASGTPIPVSGNLTTSQGTTGSAGILLLNAVSSTGAGTAYNNGTSGYTAHDIQITTTGAPTYSINFEASVDNINWTVLDTITSSTVSPNQIGSAGFYPYLRANLTSLSGGTLTALYSGAVGEAPQVSIVGQTAAKSGLQFQGVDVSGISQNVSVDIPGAASVRALPVQGIINGTPVPVNKMQLVGTTVDVNIGNATAGTQRMVLASNQPAIPVNPASTDPCQSSAIAKSSVAINVSASATTTQLVAISGTTTIYVCGFVFSSTGTSPTDLFEYGTGTNCATGTTALTGAIQGGGTTPALIISTGTNSTQFKTTAGQALCLVTGGTTPSSMGYMTYVQQ